MIMQVAKRDSELAYERMVEMLLNGTITEGQPLSERNLSDFLGLGRTPIREAVRDLIREGVLESHPMRGTMLRPVSVADLHDLYEIRFAIEGLAVELTAKRGAVEELERFATAFESALADPENLDLVQIHDDGVEFHKEVMRLSGNKHLVEIYNPFRLRFRIPFGIVRNRTPERIRAALVEHQALAQAIMSRDVERARALMCEHLQEGLDWRTEMLLHRDRYRI
ncbi:GntR family transcriptional regulator [Alcaligenaceae bacterium]|nr:GntR family transcriptional regulator [Alcaligenaceae bacterium]